MEVESGVPYYTDTGQEIPDWAKGEEEAMVISSTCRHHWLLSEPHMATVRGVCQRCGSERSYPSAIDVPEAIPEYQEPQPNKRTTGTRAPEKALARN